MRAAIAAVKESMKGTRGATMIEFAMVVPLFVLLLIGIIDFGRYFFAQHTLQFATREGTRLALVGGTLADDQGNPLNRADSIIKKIKDNASLAIDPSEISISIFPIDPDYSDPDVWDGQKNAGLPGDYMRVRTRYSYKWLTLLLSGGVDQQNPG